MCLTFLVACRGPSQLDATTLCGQLQAGRDPADCDTGCIDVSCGDDDIDGSLDCAQKADPEHPHAVVPYAVLTTWSKETTDDCSFQFAVCGAGYAVAGCFPPEPL